MKIHRILFLMLLAGVLGFAGCKRENARLKQDAKEIAEVMCTSVGIMNDLRGTNPADSARVHQIQQDYRAVQAKLTGLYDTFRKKYGAETEKQEFNDEFRRYLNAAMVDCKHLSKEQREAFEKGMQ